MPAWLKTPLDAELLRKLDGLSWDAHSAWAALHRNCAAAYTQTFARAKVAKLLARRLTERRIDAVLAELVEEGLLTVTAGTYTHAVWEQPDRDVWDDATKRERWARDKRLHRDTELCNRIKARDRNLCRYCGIRVEWGNQKGPAGGTYDHIDPDLGNEFGNVVVSCRRCNGSKKDRTPEQAGMELLRPGTSAHDLESRRRGVSPSPNAAPRARSSRPAPPPPGPPDSVATEPEPNPGPDSLVRARETGPDRTGAEPARPHAAHAGAGHPPAELDDDDRLASLLNLDPPDPEHP